MKLELYIQGGLGNQLYQYAFARMLQEKYNFDYIVIYSNSYKNSALRKLEISNYQLNKKVEFTNEIKLVKDLLRKAYHIYQKIFTIIKKKHASQKIIYFRNIQYVFSCLDIDLSMIGTKHDTFLYGYFVSSKIAEDMHDILMNEMVIKEPKSEKYNQYLTLMKTGSYATIGVSVRCDVDYVNNGWPICSKEYYKHGISLIKNKIKDCKIFVFADQIQKVKNEKWFSDDVIYVENLGVCESFELLRNCDHYVCSNSSFSWWGSFLSYTKQAIIYHPDVVFAKNFSCDDEKTRLKRFKYLNHITGEDQEEL